MALMFDFRGKTILISGGTSGIGLAIARAFLEAGASVIAAGLPTQEHVPEQIRTEAFNITDPRQIDALVASIPEIHVLVNAAGIIRRDDEFHPDVFTQVLDVNLTGT